MKMRLIWLMAVLALSGVPALAQSGGSGGVGVQPQPRDPAPKSDTRIDLRPKFERGQQIKFKLEVSNTSQQPAVDIDVLDDPDSKPPPGKTTSRPGSPARPAKPATPAAPGKTSQDKLETNKSKMEFGLLMMVKEVDSQGTATVDMTFTTIKAWLDGPLGKEEFDSTKPRPKKKPDDIDVIGTVMGPLVGSTFTMKVDRSGNISSVTGGDGFAMLGQVTPGSGGAGSLPQVFGPIFTSRKGDGFATVGQSWENADALDSGLMGKFKMTTRHTLSSASGGLAKLDMRGRIEAGSQAPGSSTFQLKDSTYSGKYEWDYNAGMLRKMDTTMVIKVEHSLQGQPVEVTNESVTKLTRVN